MHDSGSQQATDFKKQARREFDSWAEHYDRSLLHFFLFRPSYLLALEEIAKWRAARDGSSSAGAFRLLDIGCGTGEFLAHVKRTGWPVHAAGLDYSPSMCSRANVKFSRHDDDTTFITGDSEHLAFSDASFDVVTCLNSFHHYPDQQAVVRQMRRVLRPGGRVILIDGFRDNVIGWVAFDVVVTRIEKAVYHAPWHCIHEYFEQAGFDRVQRRKANVLCPVVATIGDVA